MKVCLGGLLGDLGDLPGVFFGDLPGVFFGDLGDLGGDFFAENIPPRLPFRLFVRLCMFYICILQI